MDNLKEHLKTKNYIITKERTEKNLLLKYTVKRKILMQKRT